ADPIGNDFIEPVGAVEEGGQVRLDQYRQMRLWECAPDGPQRRRAHHQIAEPVDLLDENALRGGTEGRGRTRCGGVHVGAPARQYSSTPLAPRLPLAAAETAMRARSASTARVAASNSSTWPGAENERTLKSMTAEGRTDSNPAPSSRAASGAAS